MKRWERWSFNAMNMVVAVTGLTYFYMNDILTTSDPFAVVNHPWQGSMLSLHVVAAPFVVLLFGIVLSFFGIIDEPGRCLRFTIYT